MDNKEITEFRDMSNSVKEKKRLLGKIGYAAMLEQTAEECSELSQASLKLARKIRGENPTPKDVNDLLDNLAEEITDVILCIEELTETVVTQKELDAWRDYKIQKLQERFDD